VKQVRRIRTESCLQARMEDHTVADDLTFTLEWTCRRGLELQVPFCIVVQWKDMVSMMWILVVLRISR